MGEGEGPDRRAALLERVADHLLAEGLAGARLRPLAAACGTSDRMLIYHFGSKAALVAAGLETVAGRLTAALAAAASPAPLPADALRPRLVAMVLSAEVWPYTTLWLEVAAAAARGDPVCRATGEAIGRGYLAWIEGQLAPRDPARAPQEAAVILAAVEGAAVLHALGLPEAARAAGPVDDT